MTQQDLNVSTPDKLQKPDTILQRKLLSEAGNPSKVLMFLELGILPVRYVIIMKRLNFLRYILRESTTSMIEQVNSVLKEDSRKGDFVNLVQSDLQELKLHMTDHEIQNILKWTWKKIVKTKVIQQCFKHSVNENSSKEKTRDICFENLEMAKYLIENRSTSLSKIIFGARSGTLDIKEWNIWKYEDNICAKCETAAETMSNFMTYGEDSYVKQWKDIYRNNPNIKYEIAWKIRKRLQLREMCIEEACLDLDPGSQSPD